MKMSDSKQLDNRELLPSKSTMSLLIKTDNATVENESNANMQDDIEIAVGSATAIATAFVPNATCGDLYASKLALASRGQARNGQ